MTFVTILLASVPIFLIVAVGYVTRICSLVTEESEQSIMRLTVNVLVPCFIVSRVPGNEALQKSEVVFAALGAGIAITIIGLIIAKALGHSLKIAPDGVNTFCVSSAIQNYGFIPIPLIEALFPKEHAIETTGVLFVHNLGVELVMWTVVIILLSGSMQGAWRRLINGPTIAILLGLLLNATGLHQQIPAFVVDAVSRIGACAIPIGLILCGATLTGVIQKESLKFDAKIVSGSLLLRFVLLPMLILAAASLLTFSRELREVLIIEAAMPGAIFPIILAKHFGGKPAIAVQVCAVTTLASVLLTPLVLLVAFSWFGISPAS